MTREEHAEKIAEIVKDNQRIKAMISGQNNLLSKMRDYTSADVEEAYNRGYDEGKGQAWSDEIKKYEIEPEKEREAYQRGVNDAWECAKKIAVDSAFGGISVKKLFKIFGTYSYHNVFEKYTPQEAIAKIAEYEKQKDVIKIGDEVCYTDATIAGVVVRCRNDGFYNVMDKTGQQNIRSGIEITRTGRTFPQIEEVLKAMQEGE